MNKMKLCLAIIFVLVITIFAFPTIICSTFVLTTVTICIQNIIVVKTMKYCNMWNKIKLNMLHRNVEIKLRSAKNRPQIELLELEENSCCA